MAGISRVIGGIFFTVVKNPVPTLSGKVVLHAVKPWMCQPELCRLSSSFLSRVTAEQLWKGVTSVSSAGRKKGRGKGTGKKLSQDLNRGQVIGFGPKNILWPGLNAPVVRGKEVVTQQELPPDDSRQNRIIEMRDKMVGYKKFKVHPLERGWSGNKLPGRSLGPPDPVGEETFEGFDSRVVQFRVVMSMSAVQGRVRNMTSMVVVGNKKGLVGYGYASSPNGLTAATKAKNQAAQALRFIKLYKEHTVLHDFHSTFGAVTVHVRKMPQGYGLVCHRVIREICKMVGIKDLYAKVDGPTKNTHCVVRAFFIGLMKQRDHQELANDKGLHLVELRSERNFYPEVVASPEKCRTEEEIDLHEMTDFNLVVQEGKVAEPFKIYKPFYFEFDSYKKKLRDTERFRNHEQVKLQLVTKYGKVASFVNMREMEKEKQLVKDIVEEKSD